MNKFQKIIGVGSPIVDSIAFVDDAFLTGVGGEKGGMVLQTAAQIDTLLTQLPNPPKTATGGSAGNTVFALARLGVNVAMLGKVGSCKDGGFYREAFAEVGGDTSRFKIGSVANGRCLSMVTADGERTMRTDLGAAMTLAPGEVDVSDFEDYTHAHLEGYLLFNRDLMDKVIHSARKAGCSISLDLASFEVVNAASDFLPDLLKDNVDIVFANEDEARAFTGVSEDYGEMAKTLANYCDIAVVKMGADGAYIATSDSIVRVPSIPAEEVVDSTGAGDLWAAGFLYGLSKDLTFERCGTIGAHLGSAAVQQQGASFSEEMWSKLIQTTNSVAE